MHELKFVPFALVLGLCSALSAQMTESALSAFRKDSRSGARSLYASLTAAASKDRRDLSVLIEASLASSQLLDEAAATHRSSQPAARSAAAAAFDEAAVAAHSKLRSLAAFPPREAVELSRLIASSVGSGSPGAALAALEDAIVSLCPPERRSMVSSLGAIFRAGGGKAQLIWLQALSSSLACDAAPLSGLEEAARSLNRSKEALAILEDLEKAADIENGFRSNPIGFACLPIHLSEGGAMPAGLDSPGSWAEALDPRLSGLVRRMQAFIALLPPDHRGSSAMGLDPRLRENAPEPGDGDQREGLLLVLAFEAALQGTPADSTDALLAIASSPTAREILSSPFRERERGLAAAWIRSHFAGLGLEAFMALSPARLAVVIKGQGNAALAKDRLAALVVSGTDVLSADSSAAAWPQDSGAILWRWIFLRLTGREGAE